MKKLLLALAFTTIAGTASAHQSNFSITYNNGYSQFDYSTHIHRPHQPPRRIIHHYSPQPQHTCIERRVVRWPHKSVERIINQCTGEILQEIWHRY